MEAIFVCGVSAHEYWFRQRILHRCPDRFLADVLDDPLVRPADCPRIRSLGSLVPSDERMGNLCAGPLRDLALPVHVMVPQAEMRRNSRLAAGHVWSAPIPSGAFVRVDDGLCVSSPAFCLIQLAARLSLLDVVRLASEFCGVAVSTPFEETGVGRCQPLATMEDLVRLASRLSRVRGVARVRRALTYAVAGSASPMETAVALLLSLPRSMGGYGFERPVMNHRLAMDHAVQRCDEGDYCLCDLFWPKAQVGIEYDSDAHHAQRERLYRDAVRRNRLGTLGIELLTVTRDQISDLAKFDVTARQLARHLKKPIAPYEKDRTGWASRARALRRELLGPHRCISERLIGEALAGGTA